MSERIRHPGSLPAYNRHKAVSMSGFTLLEVLVVVFIIGIIAGLATLSVGKNSQRQLQDEAERLQSLIQLAADEAILSGQELALQFKGNSYMFAKLVDNEWQQLEEDRFLRERKLPDGIFMELALEGVSVDLENENQAQRIFIFSSGEMTPFELVLGNQDEDEYTLQGDISGRLMLQWSGADA